MRVDPRLNPILDRLRALLPELRARYSVDTLEIFGSRVRGDVGGESDIDVLVTFTETPDLLRFIALEIELADRLGAPVDLVMRRSLKPRLRDRILAEAVPV
jgi:predicted nucleotidyltransferase